MSIHELPVRGGTKGGVRSDEVATNTPIQWSSGRMYAIAFDLDTKLAAAHHPTGSDTGAYGLIERVLAEFGFYRTQGSVFFASSKETTSVQCVLAVQELGRRHPWLRVAVRDIRMLRIEEHNDLGPALGRQSDLPFASGS